LILIKQLTDINKVFSFSACKNITDFIPFHQIDNIGAMVIVWRIRGKIIRSVLCSIVCNSCAQCSAHTHEQT